LKITPNKPNGKSKYNTGKSEMKIIDFEQKKEETIWEKVARYLTFGLTAYDKKGHTTEIRFKIKPIGRDMVNQVQAALPDGYFKTQAHLYRGVFAAGCIVALHHIKQKNSKDMDAVEGIFNFLNMVAREERIEEIKSEIKEYKVKLLEEDSPNAAKRMHDFNTLLKKLNKISQ